MTIKRLKPGEQLVFDATGGDIILMDSVGAVAVEGWANDRDEVERGVLLDLEGKINREDARAGVRLLMRPQQGAELVAELLSAMLAAGLSADECVAACIKAIKDAA
jgi:hypothetical protein